MVEYIVKWVTQEEFKIGTYMGREVFRSTNYAETDEYIQSVVFDNPDKWYYTIKQTWYEEELPKVDWELMHYHHEW